MKIHLEILAKVYITDDRHQSLSCIPIHEGSFEYGIQSRFYVTSIQYSSFVIILVGRKMR